MNKTIIAVVVCSFMIASIIRAGDFSAQGKSMAQVEMDARKAAEAFAQLNNKINIAGISSSIVSNDSKVLRESLADVINLNRIISAQIDAVVKSWNDYLDTLKSPSQETYQLAQVMSSCINAMRSISLRSSVDQAMTLSLVKKGFADAGMQQQMKQSQLEVQKQAQMSTQLQSLRI